MLVRSHVPARTSYDRFEPICLILALPEVNTAAGQLQSPTRLICLRVIPFTDSIAVPNP